METMPPSKTHVTLPSSVHLALMGLLFISVLRIEARRVEQYLMKLQEQSERNS